MNTPETINIEKYAEALNNLVGMDIGYLGDSDENVNAIVEVIRAAKALENRVRELEEQNERIRLGYEREHGVVYGKWVDNHCTACGMQPIGDEAWTNIGLTPPKFKYCMSFCSCCGAVMLKGE